MVNAPALSYTYAYLGNFQYDQIIRLSPVHWYPKVYQFSDYSAKLEVETVKEKYKLFTEGLKALVVRY